MAFAELYDLNGQKVLVRTSEIERIRPATAFATEGSEVELRSGSWFTHPSAPEPLARAILTEEGVENG